MALTITTVALVSETQTTATSHTTLAADFAANKLQHLAVRSGIAAGVPSTPTVTGGNRTWVQLGDQRLAGSIIRETTFRAMAATTDTSQQLTIDYAGVSHTCRYWISESDGVDTSGTNGSGAVGTTATATGSGTTASTSQSFASANNGCIAAATTQGATSFAPEAGWTELFDDAAVHGGMWRPDNDTTPSTTITANVWGMISTELIAGPDVSSLDPLGISGFFGI